MLVLALSTKDAEDIVKGPDAVDAPVVSPPLAAELLAAVVEIVVLKLRLTPVVLARTDIDVLKAFAVVSASRLFVALVLVALSLPPASGLTDVDTPRVFAVAVPASRLLVALVFVALSLPPVSALTDLDVLEASAVVSAYLLPVVLVLLALSLPPPSALTAALYALCAASSALLTAASDILYCVPPHAVCTACKGAVRNSG